MDAELDAAVDMEWSNEGSLTDMVFYRQSKCFLGEAHNWWWSQILEGPSELDQLALKKGMPLDIPSLRHRSLGT
jgi:hypothetical protein